MLLHQLAVFLMFRIVPRLLMIKLLLFIGLFAVFFDQTGAFSASHSKPNPNAICRQSAKQRNHKDLYADPSSCHHYFQCYFLNDTVSFGYRRRCPAQTFWHRTLLQCLPEGPKPCDDLCVDEVVRRNGCYEGSGCRQFFTCSGKTSQANCCPEGTRFNYANRGCTCELSPTCEDSCAIRGLANLTRNMITTFNTSVCQDQYGNTIMAVDDNSSAFKIIAAGGHATATQYCPPSLHFDLLLCRCNIATQGQTARLTQHRKALIWMPFDVDTADHSVNQYQVNLTGNASRDPKSSAVTGGGSLYVKNGSVYFPKIKVSDLRNKLSVCFFFRCDNGPDQSPHLCSKGAGLFSNSKDTKNQDYTVILGLQRFNRLIGRVNFWRPVGQKMIGAALKTQSSGWNHVCITYDSSALRLYVNAELLDAQLIGGSLYSGTIPFALGTDAALGSFEGRVDDLLITPFDMTQDEINAHFSGNRAYLVQRGFFLAS